MMAESLSFVTYAAALAIFLLLLLKVCQLKRQMRELRNRLTRVEADVAESYHNSLNAMKMATTAKKMAQSDGGPKQ